MAYFKLLALSVLYTLVNGDEQVKYAPTVTINTGKVRGLIENAEGEEVFFYQGIRFGDAKRFEPPSLTAQWDGVYNATVMREKCPQALRKNVYQTSEASENCLYLNVWQPAKLKPNSSVMVFIHGGSYKSGTIFDTFYNGRFIAKLGDVVVVSLAYRLNVFGFLYAGEGNTKTGNAGLYDMLLGLHWVKQNIHKFGGDPNKVTIFGRSAGSFAVGTLILSPLAKGLFHRGILQSGSPLSPNAAVNKTVALENTKIIAKHLECPTSSPDETLSCLKGKTTEEIQKAQNHLIQTKKRYVLPIYGDEFIPHRPQHALKSGKFNKVDVMFGTNKDEGSFFVAGLYPTLKKEHPVIDIEFVKKAIREMLFMEPDVEQIVEHYTKNLDPTNKNELRQAIVDANGDYLRICTNVLFGEQAFRHAKSNRFYSYRLMVKAPINPITHCKEWMGVCHADEVFFMFGVGLAEPHKYHHQLIQMSKETIHAWTSFAKTGNIGKMDNVNWTDSFANNSTFVQYMYLDPNHYKMSTEHYKQVCEIFLKDKLLR